MTRPPTKAPEGAAILAALAIVFALIGQSQLAAGPSPSPFGLLLVAVAVVCLAAAGRPVRFGLALGAVLLVHGLYPGR